MKPRRWFSGPHLEQWRYMTECGQCDMPFFMFPFMNTAAWESEIRMLRSAYMNIELLDRLEKRISTYLEPDKDGVVTVEHGDFPTYGDGRRDHKFVTSVEKLKVGADGICRPVS